MPIEILYHLGHTTKTLSYIDDHSNTYVQITCKLKEEITQIELEYFFNKVYKMKLDHGYSKSFEEEFNTGDLIRNFKMILQEKNVISLEQTYKILNKNEQSQTPASIAIEEFFNMFEIIAINTYSIAEYNSMIRANAMNPFFATQNTNFSKEAKIIEYNSALIELEESQDKIIQPKIKVRSRINPNLYNRAS